MRPSVIALAIVLACTAPAPEAKPSPPASDAGAAGVPAPAAAATTCDEARQRELLRSFFDGYNARDLRRVLATFRDEPLASVPFDYYDNVDGDAVQVRDASALSAYLQRRWALNDRFDINVATVGLSARFPNPTFSFSRTSDQGTYAGMSRRPTCSRRTERASSIARSSPTATLGRPCDRWRGGCTSHRAT